MKQTIKDTILVLNSNNGWKPALLLNSEGEQKELACFERDDTMTEAYASCSINWNNQLFIFGGNSDKRQISRLTGHKLERIGTLLFDHYQGSCSMMANKHIFLCFSNSWGRNDPHDYNRCRRATGPLEQFSEVALSTYDHKATSISCSDSKF